MRATTLAAVLLILGGCEPPNPIARDDSVEHLEGVTKILADTFYLTGREGKLAHRFLAAASDLPRIKTRVVYRDETTREWFSEARAMAMPEEARARLQKKELDEEFYYNTNYGTPLAYVRPLELLDKDGFSDANHTRILDFGYGGVGQLRMLASLGANVVGVEVGTLQPALYCEPSDQGVIKGHFGRKGQLTLVNGRFSEEAVVKAAGDGFDLFLSKNTLKNGYLHPEKPVDKRMLVDLGVDEETFVRTVFRILKPGGRFMIYNICPAPAPLDKPYIPWADGRSPFSKSLLESTGFKVVAFDVDDTPAVRVMGKALGWDRGEDAMDLEKDLFATYTLVAKANFRLTPRSLLLPPPLPKGD